MQDAGFYIDPCFPYLGASPDGCVSCKKDQDITEAARDKQFCIKQSGEKLTLDHNHQYFYQVQAQLIITRKKYCDFVVWTERNSSAPFVERVYPDIDFFDNALTNVRQFYIHGILPELVAKFYTVAVQNKDYSKGATHEYCFCKEAYDIASMIKCHSDTCKISYFHLKCLGLKNKPSGKRKWLCPHCRTIEKAKKKNS